MNVFAETKTNEEKEICEDILGKKILSQNRERKGDFGNAVMDLYLQLQHKNRLMKSNLKARINDGKDAQARINDK